jgi:addiction module HigA family antidote
MSGQTTHLHENVAVVEDRERLIPDLKTRVNLDELIARMSHETFHDDPLAAAPVVGAPRTSRGERRPCRIFSVVNDKVVPNRKFRRPIHPGVMLQQEFLGPLRVSTERFASHVGVPVAEIDAFVRGDRDLSPSLALRIGNAVGTSVQMWLNMQMAVDLYDAMQSPDGEAATKVRVLPEVEQSLADEKRPK